MSREAERAGQLKELTLDGTKVSGPGLKTIRQMPGIEWLSLSFLPLTDADLAELAGHTGIKTLLLYDTRVSDAGLNFLRQMPSLRFVNVGKSRTSRSGVRALEFARPGLNIIRYD